MYIVLEYMSDNIFETNYTTYIEPVYGPRRNDIRDTELTKDILVPHDYSIPLDDRYDFTDYDVYSIDPEGCEDADDAFSVYTERDLLYLAIHIADPTEFIRLHSDLWVSIVQRTTTKYLSNRKPIHMIPEQVLKMVSLQGENEVKCTISVITEINKDTYKPQGEVQLVFGKVLVKRAHAFSYKQASTNGLDALNIGLQISEQLQIQRGKKTKGVKLNELSPAHVCYENGHAYLYCDSDEEKMMKQMIAELAIFANSFVGEYLKNTLNMGVFRTCQAKEWLGELGNNITGEEMIQQIITNGITADYLSKVSSHDLVGMPEYCHFTSPIRRLSDCVCHYLLKYIYLKNKKGLDDITTPFISADLDFLSSKCLSVTKKDKKNQYLDIKFRLIQVMSNMIEQKGPITLEYYVTGYSGLFLNIIICKIDKYSVYMSYSLRIQNSSFAFYRGEHKTLVCAKVNCFTKFDQGCIPELDAEFLK